MDCDYQKRGYLLPEGCKDLIDVLKPKPSPAPFTPRLLPPLPLPILGETKGEITVAERMTVRELAALLKVKPFQVVADLLELRVMANAEQLISFEFSARVVRKYGYTVRKVG
jgi:hypothetical protein